MSMLSGLGKTVLFGAFISSVDAQPQSQEAEEFFSQPVLKPNDSLYDIDEAELPSTYRSSMVDENDLKRLPRAVRKEIFKLRDRIMNVAMILGPRAPVLSETAHLKAWNRYAFKQLRQRLIPLVDNVRQKSQPGLPLLGDYNQEKLDRKALLAANDISHILEQGEDDWFRHVDRDDGDYFMKNIRGALGAVHDGPCTGQLRHLCNRCFAESIYEVPSTTTWTIEEGISMAGEMAMLHTKLRQILNQHEIDERAFWDGRYRE